MAVCYLLLTNPEKWYFWTFLFQGEILSFSTISPDWRKKRKLTPLRRRKTAGIPLSFLFKGLQTLIEGFTTRAFKKMSNRLPRRGFFQRALKKLVNLREFAFFLFYALNLRKNFLQPLKNSRYFHFLEKFSLNWTIKLCFFLYCNPPKKSGEVFSKRIPKNLKNCFLVHMFSSVTTVLKYGQRDSNSQKRSFRSFRVYQISPSPLRCWKRMVISQDSWVHLFVEELQSNRNLPTSRKLQIEE